MKKHLRGCKNPCKFQKKTIDKNKKVYYNIYIIKKERKYEKWQWIKQSEAEKSIENPTREAKLLTGHAEITAAVCGAIATELTNTRKKLKKWLTE